mgnify:CR=1 FL=1
MTEAVNPKFNNFDQWPTLKAIEAMYGGQKTAVSKIKPSLKSISIAADKAAENLGTKGRLVYIGAGTSGRLAIQDGAELTPTFGWPKERLVYGMAGGIKALLHSIEGAEDNKVDGSNLIKVEKIQKEDVVIGVAASGHTPFTLGALKQANIMGALTIGIVNNQNTEIFNEANIGILVETGSEVLAGSTRMMAGTTQKIILNLLSTAIMTRLGHVYDGLMVDMIVSNKKLEKRAISIISKIANCSTERANSALISSNKKIKPAILIAMGENPKSVNAMLAKTKGDLRLAIEHFKTRGWSS